MFIFELDEDLAQEWQASRELCTNSRPNSSLGASALSSCKSQGYRSRTGNMKHNYTGNGRSSVAGKKIKGKKYGGPLPDWS